MYILIYVYIHIYITSIMYVYIHIYMTSSHKFIILPRLEMNEIS